MGKYLEVRMLYGTSTEDGPIAFCFDHYEQLWKTQVNFKHGITFSKLDNTIRKKKKKMASTRVWPFDQREIILTGIKHHSKIVFFFSFTENQTDFLFCCL